MKNIVFCEQCIYSSVEVHDPHRTNEDIFNPYYRCNRNSEKIKVTAADYCSMGVMKSGLPLRKEQKDIQLLTLRQHKGRILNKSTQSGCGVIFRNFVCSECGESLPLEVMVANFCPMCGVPIEGAGRDE